jgi:fatty-acyl-CoA synthase
MSRGQGLGARRSPPEGASVGYSLTPGYFRAPELDAAVFDEEGYFHTGDLGLIGDDGRVRFRGRLKEMIKTGGINVAPLEVEGVLLQHPDVKQAYVVGIPDRDKDEVVVAALELHEAAVADAGAIVAFCRERLASYKVPTRLVFRKAEEFPRTPTGKIHKPGLREELATDRASCRGHADADPHSGQH